MQLAWCRYAKLSTILAAAKREDVVEHVAAFCLQVTGGYPGTFHAACRTWGRTWQTSRPKIRSQAKDPGVGRATTDSILRMVGRARFVNLPRRCAESVPRGGSGKLRAAVATPRMGRHPPTKDGHLRSECLGAAALANAIQSAANRGEIRTHIERSQQFAVTLYRRRQYQAAVQSRIHPATTISQASFIEPCSLAHHGSALRAPISHRRYRLAEAA